MVKTTDNLLIELIKKESVTPNDAGCQKLIADYLSEYGFVVHHIRFGEVDNLFATHTRNKEKYLNKLESPVFVFGGHTDVVPTGDLSFWEHEPFHAHVVDGVLYGRGSADMKAGVSASVTSLVDFVKRHPNHPGTVALMLTSDEEGAAKDGIKKVMPYLYDNGVKIDFSIFTEPTSEEIFADFFKNGRRGSFHIHLTLIGIEGHVAYPEKALNPIHASAHVINALNSENWCSGNDYFPKTSMQVWDIKSGVANNVIPKEITISFNFRYSSEITSTEIEERFTNIVEDTLKMLNSKLPKLDDSDNLKENFKYRYLLKSDVSGKPFLTTEGVLTKALQDSSYELLGIRPKPSTSGGTSDARFVAPFGVDVIEFGVINKTIHKANECVVLDDVLKLHNILVLTMEKVLLKNKES